MDILDARGAKILSHPLTGEPITPLIDPNTGLPFRTKSGRLCWPIMGGSEDDGGDDDADDDASGDDKGKKDDDSDEDDDGDEGDASGDDSDSVSRAEHERLKRRMKESDRRADQALEKLKKREDEDKDELTRATDARDEAIEDNKTLKSTIAELRLENAFLSANTHEWHNADQALVIAKSSGLLADLVSEDDDGEIDKKALKKALDSLAKENPHLVKSSGDDDDDKTKGDNKKGPSGESRQRRAPKDKDTRQKEMKRRFTALR